MTDAKTPWFGPWKSGMTNPAIEDELDADAVMREWIADKEAWFEREASYRALIQELGEALDSALNRSYGLIHKWQLSDEGDIARRALARWKDAPND